MKKTGFLRKALRLLQTAAVFWALAVLSPAIFPLIFQSFMPPPALHLILFIGAALFSSIALSLFLIFFGGLVLSALSAASGFLIAALLASLYAALLAGKGFIHWKKREVFTAIVFAACFLFSFILKLFHSAPADRLPWIPCLLSAALTAAFAFPLFPFIRSRLEGGGRTKP